MIALLISNDDYVVNQISSTLRTSGYEVINYKWFLKGLDNILDIKPNLIVISIEDYPRHWKILCSYVATLYESPSAVHNGLTKPEIVIYAPSRFTEDDREKAKKLGARGTFKSCSDKGLEDLRNLITTKQVTTSSKKPQFMFTNPYTEVFVTGTVKDFNDNQFTFIPDILSHTMQIDTGTRLPQCSLLLNGETKNVRAQVFSISDTEPYGMEMYLEG